MSGATLSIRRATERPHGNPTRSYSMLLPETIAARCPGTFPLRRGHRPTGPPCTALHSSSGNCSIPLLMWNSRAPWMASKCPCASLTQIVVSACVTLETDGADDPLLALPDRFRMHPSLGRTKHSARSFRTAGTQGVTRPSSRSLPICHDFLPGTLPSLHPLPPFD